jgi:Ca2+:H+ antiporter
VAVLSLAAVLLGASVFASVHHAELLAVRLGEPFGSILLAIAVTIIEIGLIVSIMASDVPGGMTVARDTVFSAVMIVMNGVIGLCMVLGASRHHEQEFEIKGASSALWRFWELSRSLHWCCRTTRLPSRARFIRRYR